MASFIAVCHRVSIGKSHVIRNAFLSHRNAHTLLPMQIRPKPLRSRLTMHTETKPSQTFRTAAEAAVEDFVKTGLNIYVGGGREQSVTAVLDAIANTLDGNQVVDVAFVCSSSYVRELCEERSLPSDLAVNLKEGIDLFIAPVTLLDEDCNAVLDSDTLAADKYAAEIAKKIVVIASEEDYEKSKSRIPHISVQLVDFLPNEAVKLLCSQSLLEAGVRGVSQRSENNLIADVSIAEDALPKYLEDEFKRLPAVMAVGLLPACEKMTAVVGTADMPFDLTSSLHSMADLPREKRMKTLTGDARYEILQRNAIDWRVIVEEEEEALVKEFSFTNAEGAEAFVRYVHYMSKNIQHHPEIKHVYNRVQISLTTFDTKGITELDAMFARELSCAYKRMNGSAPSRSF